MLVFSQSAFRYARRMRVAGLRLTMIAPVMIAGHLAHTSLAHAETAPAPVIKKTVAKKNLFNLETATLANGLQIVVIPHRRAPVVRHMVWYKVGAADEPEGVSGIAHFLEHLMWKGTKTRPVGTFSATVARLGGQENAFTSQDMTAYHQTIAKRHLATMMALEADRMANLALTEKDVKSERGVILEERRSRTDTKPSALLWERARSLLYYNYPYRIPVIGWRQEMEKLSRQDAMSFYRKFYAPNNAILIIAGDVSMAEVLPLAKKYYGVIPRRPVPPRLRRAEPEPLAARRIVMKDARVGRPSWGRLYLAPSYSYGRKKLSYALEVLADVIGSSSTTRLYQSLVVRQKLADGAGAWYSGTNLGPGQFGFYASPRVGVSVARVEAAIDAEIARIVKEGVSARELARSKRTMLASAVYERDSITTVASIVGDALTTGQTLNDVEQWPARINAVTQEDVRKAAAYVLQARRSVTAILLPEKKAKKKVAPATAPGKETER